jgi:uncharacterized protein
MVQRRPKRVLGPPHDTFWEFCKEGELRLQRCEACSHISWPPVVACEVCGHDGLTWEELSGKGRVISWCTFHQKYYEELPVPWEAVLVELEDGPLFVGNADGFSTEDVRANMAVAVAFAECEDEAGMFALPVFRMA